jgi:tRNA threonylcarbamoyladenosine biosynthesis protein TsaE
MATSVSIIGAGLSGWAHAASRGKDVEIELPDLAATEALARDIAARLRPGDAVLLDGPLGAGKTALARALLRALCGDPALEVPSPSYTLVQSYDTPRFVVHHFDLWRLDGPDAVIELGWHEAREDVVLVEWPDRLGALAPADALRVDLRLIGGDARVATVGKNNGWGNEAIPPAPQHS